MFSPFFSSSNPHHSFPGSVPLLLFNLCCFFLVFFFLTLSGLVSCVTGNVTVSSFFLCKTLRYCYFFVYLSFVLCSVSPLLPYFSLYIHWLSGSFYPPAFHFPLHTRHYLCQSHHHCTLSVLHHISPEELGNVFYCHLCAHLENR